MAAKNIQRLPSKLPERRGDMSLARVCMGWRGFLDLKNCLPDEGMHGGLRKLQRLRLDRKDNIVPLQSATRAELSERCPFVKRELIVAFGLSRDDHVWSMGRARQGPIQRLECSGQGRGRAVAA